MDEAKTILNRIRDLMKLNNVYRQELCRDLKISTAQYDSWGKRNKIPSWEVLIKISEKFNVTIDYLLTGRKLFENTEQEAIYNQGFQDGIRSLKKKIEDIQITN